jgi:divalent metal cation (Fe/Co/Zn/Cd) transporter
MRSRAGVKAVAITLAILAVTALVQAAIYVATVIGNAIAARIRLRAGRRLDSPALVADGQHARSDAIVSAGVVATASVVALGVPIADPIMGLVITALILRITWESWRTVRGAHRH